MSLRFMGLQISWPNSGSAFRRSIEPRPQVKPNGYSSRKGIMLLLVSKLN
jgi:hypothetical protein